ncbi:hypothetical protein CIB48_g8369 [Xylaria polymorpha]|nr:hypothetical protein CIB48_g8369 [Xylaria polymorpha]
MSELLIGCLRLVYRQDETERFKGGSLGFHGAEPRREGREPGSETRFVSAALFISSTQQRLCESTRTNGVDHLISDIQEPVRSLSRGAKSRPRF